MKKANNWKSYAAEFLGTAVMILIGLSAVCVNFGAGSPVPAIIPALRLRLLLTGFIFAGGGALVVYSPLGSLSGGHLNPAVTLAFLLQKKMRARDAAIYMAAQAAGLLVWLFVFLEAPLTGTGINPARSLGPAAALGHIRPGDHAYGGQLWVFNDLLNGGEYKYKGPDLEKFGLYVDLQPWGSQIFEVKKSA